MTGTDFGDMTDEMSEQINKKPAIERLFGYVSINKLKIPDESDRTYGSIGS
jgi:hypothetical protein